MSRAHRPRRWPYGVALLVLGLVWAGFIMFEDYSYWAQTGLEAPGMGKIIGKGWLALVAVGTLAFVGHWGYNEFAAKRAESAPAAGPSSNEASAAPATTTPYATEQSRDMLAQTGPRYALEIRAASAQVNGWSETGSWAKIQEKHDLMQSVLPQNKEAYAWGGGNRDIDDQASASVAFSYSAGQSIDRWPLPSFLMGSPIGPGVEDHPADGLAAGRSLSGLGLALFTWEWEGNDSNAYDVIERLFAFFDAHPDVPAAFVLMGDSTWSRKSLKTPGFADLPKEGFVPPVQSTVTGLIVTRTDRVDQRMRPFVVSGVSQGVNMKNTEHDIIKLWNRFWDDTDAYDESWEKARRAEGSNNPWRLGTMQSEWWHAKLPELWAEINNKGPGHFEPSNYLPIRWTDWQIKQFDRMPILGYLHRPVRIALTKPDGLPMRDRERLASVQAAWHQALATLPEGVKPQRIFYDTSLETMWVAPLTNALTQDPEGLDVMNVDHGYDIGRRLGNTGVGSTLVEIALAAVAGYREGGASATVHLTEHGYAGIVMVSPPNEATKKANEARGMGNDPFNSRVPR